MENNKIVKTEDALKVYSADKYIRPTGYTSDIAIFTIVPNEPNSLERTLKIMLIKRSLVNAEGQPNIEGGKWALPGGFVQHNEDSYQAAKRELEEETGVSGVHVQHYAVYDKPGRDPRGWIISNAHYAIVPEYYLEKRQAADDAIEVELFDVKDVFSLPLAFDHETIISDALKMIQRDMMQTTVAKEFLAKEFTLSELWHVVVAVVGEDAIVSYENFHRDAPKGKFPFIEVALDSQNEVKKDQRYSKKPTSLYRFNEREAFQSIYRKNFK